MVTCWRKHIPNLSLNIHGNLTKYLKVLGQVSSTLPSSTSKYQVLFNFKVSSTSKYQVLEILHQVPSTSTLLDPNTVRQTYELIYVVQAAHCWGENNCETGLLLGPTTQIHAILMRPEACTSPFDLINTAKTITLTIMWFKALIVDIIKMSMSKFQEVAELLRHKINIF